MGFLLGENLKFFPRVFVQWLFLIILPLPPPALSLFLNSIEWVCILCRRKVLNWECNRSRRYLKRCRSETKRRSAIERFDFGVMENNFAIGLRKGKATGGALGRNFASTNRSFDVCLYLFSGIILICFKPTDICYLIVGVISDTVINNW